MFCSALMRSSGSTDATSVSTTSAPSAHSASPARPMPDPRSTQERPETADLASSPLRAFCTSSACVTCRAGKDVSTTSAPSAHSESPARPMPEPKLGQERPETADCARGPLRAFRPCLRQVQRVHNSGLQHSHMLGQSARQRSSPVRIVREHGITKDAAQLVPHESRAAQLVARSMGPCPYRSSFTLPEQLAHLLQVVGEHDGGIPHGAAQVVAGWVLLQTQRRPAGTVPGLRENDALPVQSRAGDDLEAHAADSRCNVPHCCVRSEREACGWLSAPDLSTCFIYAQRHTTAGTQAKQPSPSRDAPEQVHLHARAVVGVPAFPAFLATWTAAHHLRAAGSVTAWTDRRVA